MKNLTIILFFILLVQSTQATGFDTELAHSRKCVSLFHLTELQHGIPSDTLHSISLQETGRSHLMTKDRIPWPWTVNVEGKGYIFDSKQEAVKFVRRELAKGKQSIDVGCMQVNLKHHPNAFKSVEEAFDPKANVAYSAIFLRSKYDQLGNWHKAIAHYHSATPELGIKYKDSVIKIARNIDKYKKVFLKGRAGKDYVRSDMPRVHSTEAALHYKSRKPSGYKQKRYRSDMMVHVPSSSPRA